MRTSSAKSKQACWLAVDFANTGVRQGDPCGRSMDWTQFVRYLESGGVVSAERALELLPILQSDAASATLLLDRAKELHAAIRKAFHACAGNEGPSRESIETINRILRVTEGHDELVAHDGSYRLEFIARESGPEWLLASIARSAAEILSESRPGGLRLCANPACGLFFYDASPTRRRRWCSMTLCGNRHKVAAFARRRADD